MHHAGRRRRTALARSARAVSHLHLHARCASQLRLQISHRQFLAGLENAATCTKQTGEVDSNRHSSPGSPAVCGGWHRFFAGLVNFSTLLKSADFLALFPQISRSWGGVCAVFWRRFLTGRIGVVGGKSWEFRRDFRAAKPFGISAGIGCGLAMLIPEDCRGRDFRPCAPEERC
jgi:hypothetical protein